MNKIKTILIGLSLFASLIANASLVTVSWEPNHSSTAGEFKMTSPTSDFLSFRTFCIEKTQYITPGGTYSYVVGNKADAQNDPISIGTAWLYSAFRNGTIPNYVSSYSQQTVLQNTFWYLEGEIATLADHTYLNLAQGNLGNTVNLFSNANGAYGVTVWNLFDTHNNPCQSQLGMVSKVPDSTSWLINLALLLPLGVARVRQVITG